MKKNAKTNETNENNTTDRLAGLYKLPPVERVHLLISEGKIAKEDGEVLLKQGPLPVETADRMVESVAGTMPLPLGFAANFRVNGKDYVVPMAIEEASVVAAATNAAKLALPTGFTASSDEPIMTGQIQLVNVPDMAKALKAVKAQEGKLIEAANETNATIVKIGGGAKQLSVKQLSKTMMVVNFDVDVRDAMGANTINTMAERIAPMLEKLTGGKVRLRILTNLADKRLARASVEYKADVIGKEVVDGVVDAWEFAHLDPYRACTHNKGVMNGIDAVVIATGNDWRAVEAGMHAYAAMQNKDRTGYGPITKWEKTKQGNLRGSIELPLALGLVGGATKTHPVAQIALKVLNVKTAQELAQLVAAVGLAQNFAALRALSTTGIQQGHMKLHAKNIAVIAGANESEIDEVARVIAADGKVNTDYAKEVLEKLRSKK